ncbi:MAG TPA: G/U mismatch-specific DNA glycosylase [Candidatus Polarisedimenticolia bacterium]|nr:G/U mismatch-specific DNA glycosylase [Candidatus Polarisedimenticolia bacterium]
MRPAGRPRPPTRGELLAAAGKRVPDVAGPGLRVLFCGINPGLYTAAVGHHFARPGNRFWTALHRSGFTPRLFSPYEEDLLLDLGLGITNVVARATASADELSAEELREGGRRLLAKVRRLRPRFVSVLGLGAYRAAFGAPAAGPGPAMTAGRSTFWVLPNTSGLNAHYQIEELTALFRDLRSASEQGAGRE